MLCLKAAPERLMLKPKYEHKIVCGSYLTAVLDPDQRRRTVDHVIRNLAGVEFDAIAFRGLSGSLIAPIVAMEMGKTLLAVRKGEFSHSGRIVEGDYNARTYVIVDDMISSGDTIKEIVKAITEALELGSWTVCGHTARCVGVILYLTSTKPFFSLQDIKEGYYL